MFSCCFKPSADKYLEDDTQGEAAKVASTSNQKTTGANAAHAASEAADTATDTSSKPEMAQVDAQQPKLDFKTVSDPQRSELLSYAWQRKEHLSLFMTPADVRAEMLRQVMEKLQQADLYPKGRTLIERDEEYVLILRDLLNLGVILDDMEQTGWVPYSHRTAYYNLYAKVYRSLSARAAASTGKLSTGNK